MKSYYIGSKLRHAVFAAGFGLMVPAASWGQVYFGETLGAGESSRVSPNAATLAAHDEFLSALTNPGVENFESPSGNSVVFGNGVTATLLGGSLQTQGPGTNGVGRYPTSGTHFWESSEAFSLAFSEPVQAFGFYGVDIGDFDGRLNLAFYNGSEFEGNFIVPNTLNGLGGGILYYGLITAFDFDKVVFGNTASGTDFFAFDDFTQGLASQVISPVPEPSTYGLIGAAALVVGTTIRRSSRRIASTL